MLPRSSPPSTFRAAIGSRPGRAASSIRPRSRSDRTTGSMSRRTWARSSRLPKEAPIRARSRVASRCRLGSCGAAEGCMCRKADASRRSHSPDGGGRSSRACRSGCTSRMRSWQAQTGASTSAPGRRAIRALRPTGEAPRSSRSGRTAVISASSRPVFATRMVSCSSGARCTRRSTAKTSSATASPRSSSST